MSGPGLNISCAELIHTFAFINVLTQGMELRQVEKISKALSDVNRLKILQHMQGNGGCIECMEIAGLLNLAQPSISHHVKKLVEAELIEPHKDGRYYHYSLNKKTWKEFVAALKQLDKG